MATVTPFAGEAELAVEYAVDVLAQAFASS